MCALLGIDPVGARHSKSFLYTFAGWPTELSSSEPDAYAASSSAAHLSTWATPYALSIYGQEIVPQGAGPEGNGYGDGRAISIAEVVVDGSTRWELQLKGAGKTPFCRGGDGRAVLRSSVCELALRF
jgi:uncharacterized protein YdiU (UPF0061 family)